MINVGDFLDLFGCDQCFTKRILEVHKNRPCPGIDVAGVHVIVTSHIKTWIIVFSFFRPVLGEISHANTIKYRK